jgi:hypothetical protein
MDTAATTTDDAAGGRTVLLGFLWLGWVLLPPGFFVWGTLRTWSLFGQPVPPDLEQEAFSWVLAAVALAVGLPLIGLCLTVGTGRRVSAVAFAVALVAGLLVAGLVLESHPAARPVPEVPAERTGVVCQEHSGGDTRCPGG